MGLLLFILKTGIDCHLASDNNLQNHRSDNIHCFVCTADINKIHVDTLFYRAVAAKIRPAAAVLAQVGAKECAKFTMKRLY